MIYISGDEAKQFHTVGTAVALGKFDGIHLGHRLLIDGLLEERKKGRQALVFTFGTAPREVLYGGSKKMIYTSEEKAYYFSRLGIDVLFEYPFTKQFAACPPEEFVEQYLLRQLGVRSIYVGADFHFGCGRRGNVALLQALGEQYHFEVNVINRKTLHGKVISSTLVRDMLESHLQIANEMLGNPYFVYAPVVHGKHLGHTIGFPTINQPISTQKLIPACGVYASRVLIDGDCFPAISNLGMKPTIEGKRQVGLETHILNYQGNLYDRVLHTELLYYIRPEERFSGIEELREQIQNDIRVMLSE